MQITFDPSKDALNQAKHGLSLKDAEKLIWEEALVAIDESRNYGEVREIAYAPIGQHLYCVVFTDRGDERRVISLRKANSRR
jgi:uncharacterized DUF497 family protein